MTVSLDNHDYSPHQPATAGCIPIGQVSQSGLRCALTSSPTCASKLGAVANGPSQALLPDSTPVLPPVGAIFPTRYALVQVVGRAFTAGQGRIVLDSEETGSIGVEAVVFKCCYKDPACTTRLSAVNLSTPDGTASWRVVVSHWGHTAHNPPSKRQPSRLAKNGMPARARSLVELNSGDEASSVESESSVGSDWSVNGGQPASSVDDNHCNEALKRDYLVAPTPASHSRASSSDPAGAAPPSPVWGDNIQSAAPSSAPTPSGLTGPASPDSAGSFQLASISASSSGMEVDAESALDPHRFSHHPNNAPTLSPPVLAPDLGSSLLAVPMCSPPIVYSPACAFATAWEPQSYQASPFSSPFASPFDRSAVDLHSSPAESNLYASTSTSTLPASLAPALALAALRLHPCDSPHPPSWPPITWFAFLFELDPELTAHADLLSHPELGVTPASFFRQRRELRTLFLCGLAGKVQEWPRMCLQDAIERDGERVWAAMQGQDRSASGEGAGWNAGASSGGSEGLMFTY